MSGDDVHAAAILTNPENPCGLRLSWIPSADLVLKRTVGPAATLKTEALSYTTRSAMDFACRNRIM